MNVAPEQPPTVTRYRPRGAALQAIQCQESECLLSGPAGTGKSIANLVKLHVCCERIPRVRCLIVRKTRESLTESALVTFESKVLPQGHPALAGPQRKLRQSYRYPNGSEIIIGGMDKPSKVMSTEYDLIFPQEAIEFTEADWESLLTRLRNNRMAYQQIIADTNPDSPTHWLKKRCDAGKTLMLDSRHEDNPTLWDATAKQWTVNGTKYLAKLDALTGNRRQRLRFGRWVQAEGVVYEAWDSAVHVVDRFRVPMDWPRYLAIDFGYTDPFVAQWWAKCPEGRLYLYREIVHTGRLVEDHARRINSLCDGEPKPRAVVCDHDREGRATLEKYLGVGVTTTAAVKGIEIGIQAVAARLKRAADGKPRLYVMRGVVVERDPVMVDAKKPIGFVEEVDGYVWDTGGGRKKGEVPVDKDNHSMDPARYIVMYHDGPKKEFTAW